MSFLNFALKLLCCHDPEIRILAMFLLTVINSILGTDNLIAVSHLCQWLYGRFFLSVITSDISRNRGINDSFNFEIAD